MAKIRSKGSKMELKMKEALESNMIDFEYQPKLFGRPDFLVKPNIAVFCDSLFWHGRNWHKLRKSLPNGYWREHIAKNRERDRLVNKRLLESGYCVLRFWEEEIDKSIDQCLNRILEARTNSRAPSVQE